jgi:hypothetical protein
VLWHLVHWICRYKQWDHPHVECFVIWRLTSGPVARARCPFPAKLRIKVVSTWILAAVVTTKGTQGNLKTSL